MKNDCDIGIKTSNGTASTSKEDANKDSEKKQTIQHPLSDSIQEEEVGESGITESSKLLRKENKDEENGGTSRLTNLSVKKEPSRSNRKKSPSTITPNYLPEEASPLLKQRLVQAQPPTFDGLRASSFRPKPTLLYATTCGDGGRSASVAVSSSQLEPTYPWDYDQDNDDVGDNTSLHSDVFAGMATRQDRYRMSHGEGNDEFQHPSLETRKLIHKIINDKSENLTKILFFLSIIFEILTLL